MSKLKEILRFNREFLRCAWWARLDDFPSDQKQGKDRPLVQKPYPAGSALIDLTAPELLELGDTPVRAVIAKRSSHRYYTRQPLSLDELSFLLWATQGIREVTPDGVYYKRTVPSGGNRHPFETYLSIHNIGGLETGLYRFLPVEHKLLLLREDAEIALQVNEASFRQDSEHEGQPYYFVENSAVTFIWTAIPYRTEWRYGPAAGKLIAQDSGHVCQSLYIACGAIGAGTVAMGSFDHEAMDKVLGVDGEDEFSIYMAPVGKI